MTGKLYGYLYGIDRQAEDMFSRLVKQMAERESITEQFKAENQMAWVCAMSNIYNRAQKVVLHDIVYAGGAYMNILEELWYGISNLLNMILRPARMLSSWFAITAHQTAVKNVAEV